MRGAQGATLGPGSHDGNSEGEICGCNQLRASAALTP